MARPPGGGGRAAPAQPPGQRLVSRRYGARGGGSGSRTLPPPHLRQTAASVPRRSGRETGPPRRTRAVPPCAGCLAAPSAAPPLGVPDELVGEEGEAVTDSPGADEAQGLLLTGLAEEAPAGPERDREGSYRCTATGCSDPSRTPRTPSRTRCWPPGGASAGTKDARRSAPGSTGSPPISASTRVARPAGARPGGGTCPMLNRPTRPGSARSSGSSPIPTPCSTVRSTCRPARRPATSRPNPSRWPS